MKEYYHLTDQQIETLKNKDCWAQDWNEILVSENTDKILPTILSRTQILKINKLPVEEFVSTVSELIGCDSEKARVIGYITDFNLQQALEMGVNVVDADNYEYFVKSGYKPTKIYLSNIADIITKTKQSKAEMLS